MGAITVDQYPLADLPTYSIPGDGDLESYKIAIRAFPQDDHPLAFGQHPNADISSKMEDTKTLLDTIISLQPKAATEGEETNEVKVIRRVDTLKAQVPQPYNVRSVRKIMETRSRQCFSRNVIATISCFQLSTEHCATSSPPPRVSWLLLRPLRKSWNRY